LANSGLRVGEAREMLWSDIKFDVAVEGSESVIAEVRVSKATKKGEARFVQTQPNANSLLKRWRETSQYNKHNDLVWFGQVDAETREVRKFVDLNRGFQIFLKRVPYNERVDGLLYEFNVSNRSNSSVTGDLIITMFDSDNDPINSATFSIDVGPVSGQAVKSATNCSYAVSYAARIAS
jgi:hypothetical protein